MERNTRILFYFLVAGNVLFLALGLYFLFSGKETLQKTEQEKSSYIDSLEYYKKIARAGYFTLNYDTLNAKKEYANADSSRLDQRNWSQAFSMFLQAQDSTKLSNIKLLMQSGALGKELQENKLFSDRLQETISVRQNEVDSLTGIVIATSHLLTEARERITKLEYDIEAVKQSKGKLVFANPEAKDIRYFGEIVNGKANGYGIGIFASKGIYDGTWKDNLRHGKGIYQWANEDRYEGEYAEGKRNGYGIYYFSTGERYDGYWKNDLRDGKGTFYSAEGKVLIDGNWKADKYVKNGGTDE